MFQRAEQERAESSPAWLRRVEAAAREQLGEELLREFARRIFIAAFAAEEPEDGRPVRFAEFTHRRTGFR